MKRLLQTFSIRLKNDLHIASVEIVPERCAHAQPPFLRHTPERVSPPRPAEYAFPDRPVEDPAAFDEVPDSCLLSQTSSLT